MFIFVVKLNISTQIRPNQITCAKMPDSKFLNWYFNNTEDIQIFALNVSSYNKHHNDNKHGSITLITKVSLKFVRIEAHSQYSLILCKRLTEIFLLKILKHFISFIAL